MLASASVAVWRAGGGRARLRLLPALVDRPVLPAGGVS